MDAKLAAKTLSNQKTSFTVGNVEVGKDLLLIAGPCSIESREQILRIAHLVANAGANMLRGGAYKPRSSPYSFQGLGRVGLEYLREAGDATGLPVVSEVMDPRDVYLMCEYIDVMQIGARNMQNYSLLKEVGATGKPVLLKRGMHASIEEWLYCAEYILLEGNNKVILCERGIRTTETYTRNTMDLSAVAVARELSHLPIITDPSHGTGRPSIMEPMSLASIIAGSDGCVLEVHDQPEQALSDGDQALLPEHFARIAARMRDLWNYRQREASGRG